MPTLTVRYFAAARAAAGVLEEQLTMPEGATIAHVLRELEVRHGEQLGQVIQRSSFLLDEIAVRDTQSEPDMGSTLDILPPFAGG
jgi:molybdopterin synthase sulfur carrier subunit